MTNAIDVLKIDVLKMEAPNMPNPFQFSSGRSRTRLPPFVVNARKANTGGAFKPLKHSSRRDPGGHRSKNHLIAIFLYGG
ncbi:MAG: hypothetical protein J0H71_03060 [Rhizobiales bacterium]|nr:hypothetical protein [Hyphomicrobiales bacterium]